MLETRTPRYTIPHRTAFQDIIALSHPLMFLPILCFLVIGTFMAPEVNYLKLVLVIVGVYFGVNLGAYRINAIKDGGSVLSDRTNLVIACVGVSAYVAFVAVSTAIWGWPVALMGGLGAFAIMVYNGSKNKIVHNSIFYGLCWGMFPVALSYCFQTMSWPSVPVILFGIAAMVYAREATWLHGGRSCGIWALCRNKGKYDSYTGANQTCHSNAIRCSERLVMPKSINEHMKLMIRLNDAVMVFIALSVVSGYLMR